MTTATTQVPRRLLLPLALGLALGVSGCGGDSPKAAPTATAAAKPAKSAQAPPSQDVLQTVTTILEKCGAVRFDPSADISDAIAAVDDQVRLFKEYDPDAQLEPSALKATTMREVLEGTRDDLNDCSPNDVARVSEALTSK